MIACSRSYGAIPDTFFGAWESDGVISDQKMQISQHHIVLTDEDGRSRTCKVDYVKIRYQIFGQGKSTMIFCDTRDPDVVKSAYAGICDERSNYYNWSIDLSQEKADFVNGFEAKEYSITSCDEEANGSLLGAFYRAQ